MVKTGGCEKTYVKKGLWTPEEDRKLIAYIRTYGIWNWTEMPKAAGLLRCGKSCRLRWKNYLRPDIKRGNFSQEEDQTIIKLHELLGNRWSAIASRLPGRTDNEIKNQWHTRLKKRQVPTTKSLKGTQKTANIPEAKQINPNSDAPKASDFDVCKATPDSQQISTHNFSSSSSSGSPGEIYNNQTLEDQNSSCSSETYGELESFWEQPFIMEDFLMMESYGETHTDPGIMVSTSLWGLEEDIIFPSVPYYDANDDFLSCFFDARK